MSPDVDDDLRRLFDKSASTIGTISPGFTDTVLTEGARRRRSRRFTAAGGAAAAVLLVSGALWQVPDMLNNSSPVQPADPSRVTATTTSDVGTRFSSPGEWAASLPRGEDVHAAYAVKQTLYAGDVAVPVTGADVKSAWLITVHGPTAGGWLANVRNYEQGTFRNDVGIIAPDGTFTSVFAFSGLFSSLLVSPDGSQFALGPDVRDAETGELLTSFTHRNVVPAAWLDEGIVYAADRPSNTRMWLWQPGSPPQQTFPFALASTNGIVVTVDGDCAGVGPLSEPPSTYQRVCEGGEVLSISPYGERVFTDEFTVVDVASGDATALPVPAKSYRPGLGDWSALNLTTFWEDEDHLVLLIPGENQAIFSFVRCEISTKTCERASDELQVDDSADAPRRLSPLE